MCLISLGDFCIGIYLINVFIVDQHYGEGYCSQTYEWVTSSHCTGLGVLSTFGTQLSIFTMLCLSAYRVLTLKTLGGRARVASRHKVGVVVLSAILILGSMVIAVLPILDFTEDYFTNGLYYKSNNMFNKVASLEIHSRFINSYKNLTGAGSRDLPASYTWRQVREFMAGEVFSGGLAGVQGKSLKFYGNDGVCLFKYFVSPDDPQRIFSLAVLSLNLLCFLVISTTYINVILTASGSSNKTAVTKDTARGAQLQTKITLMVLTNILSWVPFAVICILHTLDKIDATRYYKVSSILLLPINSCVNPVIYSNVVPDCVSWARRTLRRGRASTRTSVTRIRDRLSLSFATDSAKDVKLAVQVHSRNTTQHDQQDPGAERPRNGRLSNVVIGARITESIEYVL